MTLDLCGGFAAAAAATQQGSGMWQMLGAHVCHVASSQKAPSHAQRSDDGAGCPQRPLCRSLHPRPSAPAPSHCRHTVRLCTCWLAVACRGQRWPVNMTGYIGRHRNTGQAHLEEAMPDGRCVLPPDPGGLLGRNAHEGHSLKQGLQP